jgi:hypothetical protein
MSVTPFSQPIHGALHGCEGLNAIDGLLNLDIEFPPRLTRVQPAAERNGHFGLKCTRIEFNRMLSVRFNVKML